MSFLRKNPLLLALFVLILGPTIVLALFSFRSVSNESFLAQKTLEERQRAFKGEVEDAFEKEQAKLMQEVKAASVFLYEQPSVLMDFVKSVPFKQVDGVEALFLFNGDTLIYPHIPGLFLGHRTEFSGMAAFGTERVLYAEEVKAPEAAMRDRTMQLMRGPFAGKTERKQNLLGLLRLNFRAKRYDEALEVLEHLERGKFGEGYLLPDLKASLRLLHFEILVAKKEHREAEKYAVACLRRFLAGESYGDIATVRFFFESMFDMVLSFEDLEQDARESFWNLRENLSRELSHTEFYLEFSDRILRMFEEPMAGNEGFSFELVGGEAFFRMSAPWLAGNQVVVGFTDKEALEKRFTRRIRSLSRDWKDIPFAIRTNSDSLIISNVEEPGPVKLQNEASEWLHWQLVLYEKDMKALRMEARRKILMMGGVIILALIMMAFGSFFMFRFVEQERRLLAMKANFLSSISHELKTPLTSIKMFAEMLAKGRVKTIERVPEYANLINKEATRLENLIGAILNYTRMENGRSAFQWERLNLATCAERVYEAVEPIAVSRGLTIDKQLAPDNFITGDYTAIYSMLQNLIENAIKYTNPPGEIHVRVYEEGDKAVFEVADTGVGIEQAEQKNIFNDFYRVGDEMTRSTKGSGLGLAIVKRAADAHKAAITLSSKPGKGSTFTVKFRKAE